MKEKENKIQATIVQFRMHSVHCDQGAYDEKHYFLLIPKKVLEPLCLFLALWKCILFYFIYYIHKVYLIPFSLRMHV